MYSNDEIQKLVARYFHGEEGYNCCQAVLKILQTKNNTIGIKDSDIQEARNFGGGRAKDGMCGALYALELVAKDDKQKEEFKNIFSKKMQGEFTCRGIKGNTKTPCETCVFEAVKIFSDKE